MTRDQEITQQYTHRWIRFSRRLVLVLTPSGVRFHRREVDGRRVFI